MKLNWNTMSPDEKKVAVAIHIFGWKPEVRKMYAGEKNVKGWGLNQHLERGDRDRQFCSSAFYFPNYTTDPAACAEVKGKFVYWQVTCERHYERVNVSIVINGATVQATAPTEEEAFAKAALRASGMEVEG